MALKRGLVVLLTLAGILVIYAVSTYAAPNNNLQVSFINVGEGDSALISDSSGFDVLIDGGNTSAGPTVVAYLREQSVDDIDVMVASHADSDHIGGLISVLEAADIPVQEVLYNGYPGNTTTWLDFTTAVANEGLTLTAAQFPTTFTWGTDTAYILNPVPGLSSPNQDDVSVVVLLDHGDIEFLFTGDIDAGVESDIVARGTPVAAEILKVSHHGSEFGSSADFLSEVQPSEAVISVGSNPYGHPADETLSRLLTAGARVWRTDELGNIQVASDGTFYEIISQISPEPVVRWVKPVETVVGCKTVTLEVEVSEYVPVHHVLFYRWDPVQQKYIVIGVDDSPPYQSELDPEVLRVNSITVLAAAYDEAENMLGGALRLLWFGCELRVYLPIVANNIISTPVLAETQSPSATSTETPTPTDTQEPASTGNIVITNVFFDGVNGRGEPDEYVELRNEDAKPIQIGGWTLRDIADHVFTFPNFIIRANQVCRVYTNKNHPEWCGFDYGCESAIWNNTGDCAYLRDGQGTQIDEFCY